MPTITPCLWFDDQGEEAAAFYTAIFPNSRVTEVTRYGEAGPGTPGTVLTVAFELDGQPFVALNGGPKFTFNEAISFQVDCEDQDEVDHYWSTLPDGGKTGPCGWLGDRFGVAWQIVPTVLTELLGDSDEERSQRVMTAMLAMTKPDIAAMERAAAGHAAECR